MSAFRKLIPADASEMARHLLRLDPADRHSRFHAAESDEAVKAHVQGLDWARYSVIGCFQGGALRGMAELAFDRVWMPRSAELAVTVENRWQHRGVGTELVQRAARLARNRGVSVLTMLCLTENQPMRKIAARLKGHVLLDGGQVESQVTLPVPTPLSLIMEAVSEATDRVETFADDWLADKNPS